MLEPSAAKAGFRMLVSMASLLTATASLAASAQAQESRATSDRGRAPAMWWQQLRVAEVLALTAEQRSGLDALLEDRIEARRDLARRFRRARADVARAARDGDWEAARAARVGLGEAASRLSSVDADLLIDAMRLLTAEQRATLAKEFPAVLRRPWLVGGPGAFGRFGGGRPPG